MRGYKNFESNPHPGNLRHLVEIGYTENSINENGYDTATHQYTVQWTWCLYEEALEDAP